MKGSTMKQDGELITLNFVTAGLSGVMLIFYAGLFFEVSQARGGASWLAGLFCLLLINVVLCLGGVIAGVGLMKGEQHDGRVLTAFIAIGALVLLLIALASLLANIQSRPIPGPIKFQLMDLIVFGPVLLTALVYCVLVLLVLRRRSRAAPLSIEQIIEWADKHRASTGHWPRPGPEAIISAPDHPSEGHCLTQSVFSFEVLVR